MFGRQSATQRRRLLIGSHTDSVSAGGRLDGVYGVVAALEVLRALVEAGDPAADYVEVVDFADEEGVRFPCGYFGSKALTGALDVSALGQPALDVLRGAGVDGRRIRAASTHLKDVAGYIEIHIEQGPRLESSWTSVAPVLGILGFDRYRIHIRGRSQHGGTTPFALRRDPSRAAAELISAIPKLVSGMNPAGTATVGVLSSTGGAINFTPGEVELSLEVRQPTRAALAATVAAVRRRLKTACNRHRCVASMARQHLRPEIKDGMPVAVEPAYFPPVTFDTRLLKATRLACSSIGVRARPMHAGTWHDAGIMAARVPAAMLLVPSLGGVTHAPSEATRDRDLVQGARALLRATQLAVDALGLS